MAPGTDAFPVQPVPPPSFEVGPPAPQTSGPSFDTIAGEDVKDQLVAPNLPPQPPQSQPTFAAVIAIDPNVANTPPDELVSPTIPAQTPVQDDPGVNAGGLTGPSAPLTGGPQGTPPILDRNVEDLPPDTQGAGTPQPIIQATQAETLTQAQGQAIDQHEAGPLQPTPPIQGSG